jgi:S1-C subfamily serine protease
MPLLFIDRCWKSRITWLYMIIALTVGGRVASGQFAESSVRRTPLVDVIEKAEAAVVSLFTQAPQAGTGATGSGAIIHPRGFVLTNYHVLPYHEGFAVYEGKAIRFRLVGCVPEKDVAIVQLLQDREWPFIPIARRDDLMNGETVITAGNPGGRGIVFTSGIISRKSFWLNASNALAMTQFTTSDRRDSFIQFDAASNKGSSGGPLMNLDGQLIGIVSGGFSQEQNVNYAIPIGRVRELACRAIEPEIRHQRKVGIIIDSKQSEVVVLRVEPESPAQIAGVKTGDIIRAVGTWSVHHSIDWVLALNDALPKSESLQLSIERDGASHQLTLPLGLSMPSPSQSKKAIQPGLDFKYYSGGFTRLPDFKKLEPTQSGVTTTLDLASMAKPGSVNFGLVINGFIEVPETGLYRLQLTSDDGSFLYVNDELVVDNDFNHPPQAESGLRRLEKSLHPIRVEYYQGTSNATLALELFLLDADTWKQTPVPLKYFR